MDTITSCRHNPGEVCVQSHLKTEKTLRAQGMPFTISVVNEVLTLHGTDKSYKHATRIDRISDDVLLEIFDVWRSSLRAFSQLRNGTPWCMYVEDGDKSYSSHHTDSISEFSANLEVLSGRICAYGQHYLSLSSTPTWRRALHRATRTMPLLPSRNTIAYVLSRLKQRARSWKRWQRSCRSHFRCWRISSLPQTMEMCRPFPPNSYKDPLPVCR